MSPTPTKSTETKKNNTPSRNRGKQSKPEIVSPAPKAEKKNWFDPSSIGWDLVGVLLLALGLMLLLAVLGFTRGLLLDIILKAARRWFGLGRYLLPGALLAGGWLLLLWRKGQHASISAGRVVLLELGLLFLLGSLSAIAKDTVLDVEAGISLGGSTGWGLAHPLVELIGSLGAGIVLSLLSLLFLLYGLNLFGRLEAWAREKAGTNPEQYETETTPSASSAAPPAVDAVAVAQPRKTPVPPVKTQETLPLTYQKRRPEPQKDQKPELPVNRPDVLPPLSLLEVEKPAVTNEAAIQMNAAILERTLGEFGIPAKVVGHRVGPAITQFAVEPGYIEKNGSPEERQKVRVSKISSLSRDLALALKAERLRIEAPVPGKPYVGIEVPNAVHTIVKLRPILESEQFQRVNSPLAIPLGRDVSGMPMVADLAVMPHLLIAGATNSGKSVCIAAITTCLAMNNKPEDLRLVMIDPKRVELTRFNGLPHLLGQVETDLERIRSLLRWAVGEMEARYKILEEAHSRNLDSYNARMSHSGKPKLPRVVIMIDELADLMLASPEETDRALVRLAQKARAVGIHLIVATQRPSVDVITGSIKANFPARLAFTVASLTDSQVILGMPGAETLLGKGDMLFLNPQTGQLERSQGVYVSDAEIDRVITWWQKQTGAEADRLVQTEEKPAAEEKTLSPWEQQVSEDSEDGDEALIKQAVNVLRRTHRASASYLQRQLHLSYPRAAWLIDELENRGIIGPAQSGGKNRQILLDDAQDTSDEGEE
ncbi:MAG TPA: DNA translocase FtsK [Anaerolineaceae bacterium]|nr:DNA translocase FtsK [Anaerolineaceae bacterium]